MAISILRRDISFLKGGLNDEKVMADHSHTIGKDERLSSNMGGLFGNGGSFA